MIDIGVFGAAGRMGKRIIALANQDGRFVVTSAFEKHGHPKIGADCGELAGIGSIGVEIGAEKGDFDVLIDFSSPEGILNALDLALNRGSSLVSGTTGLGEEHFRALKDASEKIGVFYASNFSMGITVLAKIAVDTADYLLDSDIEIVEAHHNRKADSPSGTALSLAGKIAETRGEKLENLAIYGRDRGKTGPRSNNQIGIHAVRGGGIIGEHKIMYILPHEMVVLEHRAFSRDVFAAGALEAANFVVGKTGYFDMENLFNPE